MANNIQTTSADKSKSVLNGMKPEIPGIEDVKDGVDTLRNDVSKVRADASDLACTIRDAASGSVKKGSDYVQDRVDTVKKAGADVIDKVASIQDTPLRKAAVAVVALCALSFLFGRKKSS